MNTLSIFRYIPESIIKASAKLLAMFINTQKTSGMLWKTRVNISLCYPSLTTIEQEKLAKKSVTNQCLYYANAFKCLAMPIEWNLNQIKNVYNLDTLTEALADAKGTLIIIPHLGNWEILNPWVHQYGTPTIMYKPIRNKTINEFILASRNQLNTTMVPTDSSGVRALFKTLKQGGFSIILPDHVPAPSGGIIAPFFGINTLTSTLAPKMIQKTKCRVVSMICVNSENEEGYNVYLNDVGEQYPEIYNSDINISTTTMNNVVEDLINQFPEHYMWGYKRFKGSEETKEIYQQQ